MEEGDTKGKGITDFIITIVDSYQSNPRDKNVQSLEIVGAARLKEYQEMDIPQFFPFSFVIQAQNKNLLQITNKIGLLNLWGIHCTIYLIIFDIFESNQNKKYFCFQLKENIKNIVEVVLFHCWQFVLPIYSSKLPNLFQNEHQY